MRRRSRAAPSSACSRTRRPSGSSSRRKAFSRAELDRLEELAKEWGAKGLAYLVIDESGEVRSPIAKFLSERELEALRADPGSTVLFVADEPRLVTRVLGFLRLHLGRELGLVDESRDEFLWVVDFPLFELDEETGRWTFSHHPFTGIAAGHEDLIESDPGAAAEPGLRPRLERVGARLRVDPDPPAGRPGSASSARSA